MSIDIRVRFAPSPTGYLHIGGARTALYNWLFAKKHGGTFILRIEDTDAERSVDEFVNAIFGSLDWLGIDWDEGPEPGGGEKGKYGPYLQSKRNSEGIYINILQKLLERGKVYKCFCTPDELKASREQAMKDGRDPGYDGKCRGLTEEQGLALEEQGLPAAYRIKTPGAGRIVFEDMVKGSIYTDLTTINDFVIVKSNGMPTYNFACVADDLEMMISHVIRGDDHISNTPKQILLYRALGVDEEDIPHYAHLPQVHGSDGKKLSKRTGAVSVEEYMENGYLPEALMNYLALIGWSTEDSQQIFEGEELIDKFDLSRCSKSAGIFDPEKLNWMNGKYIRNMPAARIAAAAATWLMSSGLISSGKEIPRIIIDAIELEKEKIELLSDIPGRIDILVKNDIEYDQKAVDKRLKKEGAAEILSDILKIMENMDDFSHNALEVRIREYCESKELGAGKVFHPLRVAVSGRMQGPGVFELLEILGKDKVISRIKYTLDNLV